MTEEMVQAMGDNLESRVLAGERRGIGTRVAQDTPSSSRPER